MKIPGRFHVTSSGTSAVGRIESVDALRGFDMFWIIGGEYIIKSLDSAVHSPATSFLSNQLDHVEWTGFRFYDIIMPLFLFIVGVSIPFSYKRRLEKDPNKSHLWKHIIRRFIILWILGMAVQGNLLGYDFSQFKFYSNTLQAIASGYLIASIVILYLRLNWQVITAGILLFVYWMVLMLVPIPGIGAGAFTPHDNFAIYLDKLVFGSFQDGTTYSWILSSLNFGVTVLLGVFTGYFLQSDYSKLKKIYYLVLGGFGLIVLALLWNIWLPIVKHIWTSSFVLFAGGISVLLVALFSWMVDYMKWKKAFSFFIVIGMNAIFAYMAAHLFDWGLIADVFLKGLEKYVGSYYGFIRAIGGFSILYFILYLMYRNKIFIKI